MSEILLHMLLPNPARWHLSTGARGDDGAEDLDAQGDPLRVVPESTVTEVTGDSLAVVEPLVNSEVVRGLAAPATSTSRPLKKALAWTVWA
jgi:hypothetical protein